MHHHRHYTPAAMKAADEAAWKALVDGQYTAICTECAGEGMCLSDPFNPYEARRPVICAKCDGKGEHLAEGSAA